MGWQDRDYARASPHHGGAYRTGPGMRPGGRSIVTTLIVINVAVFALGALVPAVGRALAGYQTISPQGAIPHYGYAEMWAEGVMRGQVWRLITAQYLHAGVFHLFINMFVLHFLGRPLERMWSARRFFAVYTLAGLCGNVFYTVLATRGVIEMWMPAVGASGCIYGLLGIVAVLFPSATVYVYFLFPIKIRTAAYIFGGIAVFTIMVRGSNFGGEACHLAGLVFGVWWAMKGEGWWRRSQWRLPRFGGRFRRSKPRAKPGVYTGDVAQRRQDADTIDRILRKVYDGGIHSLSASERTALQEATKRQQDRDAQADLQWGKQ